MPRLRRLQPSNVVANGTGSHASPRYRSAACRRRCPMARPRHAVKEIHKTGRDLGLAESGFALLGSVALPFTNTIYIRATLLNPTRSTHRHLLLLHPRSDSPTEAGYGDPIGGVLGDGQLRVSREPWIRYG